MSVTDDMTNTIALHTLCAFSLIAGASAAATTQSTERVSIKSAPPPLADTQPTEPNSWLASSSPAAFPDDSLRRWTRKDFSGQSSYEILDESGLRVLKGSTDGAATLLFREKHVDLTGTPWLNWSWKVDTVYTDIDERSRAGDDYPARLYVVANTGFLPWEKLAINYVWSSEAAIDSLWPSPYTDRSAMIAVQSGASKVGEWTLQRRNIADDFQRAFGKNVREISGFAVMVDGDNAGGSATAWFGNIDFSAH